MNQLANYLGKVALLIFMCVGLVVSSTTAASANTKPGSKRTSAKTVKTNSTDKTKKPKRRSIKKKDVTLDEAQQIALRKVPGSIENGELRTEKGASVYAFEIRDKKGKTINIWVDQHTGKVVHRASERSTIGKK